jgi:hypothetical protein
MRRLLWLGCLLGWSITAAAQDTDTLSNSDISSLEALLDQNGNAGYRRNYTTATFKTTRLINGQTIENTAAGVLDIKIQHRFGAISQGAYEMFGLDNASIRIGADYGLTDRIMIGLGRSSYEKTWDGFTKIKLLRQQTGDRNIPVSISYFGSIAVKTLRWSQPDRENYFSSRLYFTNQLTIARKFTEGLSLQLMPTLVHRNMVPNSNYSNDVWAIGIGGRQKLSKRVSINAEYYYVLPEFKSPGTYNSLSIGFDIETGGHVFQLHFSNSTGMIERAFIAETTGQWLKGDIHFGFNISRVFTLNRR